MATPKIAIVSNNEAIRWLLIELLTDAGYEVIVVYQPSSITTMVARTRPQLIIVEVGLNSAADEWSLVEELSHDPTARESPVLTCSVDRHMAYGEVPACQRPNVPTIVFPAGSEMVLATVSALIEQQPVPVVEQPYAVGSL